MPRGLSRVCFPTPLLGASGSGPIGQMVYEISDLILATLLLSDPPPALNVGFEGKLHIVG